MTAPKKGQIWRENDPRFVGDVQRYLLIEVVDGDRIGIRRVNEDGSPYPKARSSYAAVRRFNDKRGGYSLHRFETI